MAKKFNIEKVITVTDTSWGKEYKIAARPVGKEHSRVELIFDNGKHMLSKMLYKNIEIGEPIHWLMEYTKTSNLYPLFDKFKEDVIDSPF